MFSLDGFVNNIGKAIDIADAEGIPVQDALRRMSMYERQKEEEKKKKQIQAYTNEINFRKPTKSSMWRTKMPLSIVALSLHKMRWKTME